MLTTSATVMFLVKAFLFFIKKVEDATSTTNDPTPGEIVQKSLQGS